MSRTKKEREQPFHFSGFDDPNYTSVPDVVFDQLLPVLSGAELKVLLYVIRRTFGFKKRSDNISLSQMLHGVRRRAGEPLDGGVGLTKKTLLQSINSLEAKGIIVTERRRSVEKGDEPTAYRLNMRNTPEALDEEKSTPPVGEKFPHGGGGETTPGTWGKNSPTQQTVRQNTDEQDVVVATRDALENFGVTKAAAAKLAATYPEQYILAKLDLVQWLVETRSPLVGKNPAGYLRRAIEEDYAAPPKYKSPAQRQAEAEAHDQAEQNEQERRRAAEADYARAKVLDQQQLAEHYPPQPIPGTTLTTQQAWEQTLDQLHTQVTRPNFEMWLRPTTLVSCDGQRAVIAAPSRYHTETLAGRLTPLVQHALSTVLSTPVQCQYVPMSDLLEVGEHSENGRTPRDFRSPTGQGHPQAASP